MAADPSSMITRANRYFMAFSYGFPPWLPVPLPLPQLPLQPAPLPPALPPPVVPPPPEGLPPTTPPLEPPVPALLPLGGLAPPLEAPCCWFTLSLGLSPVREPGFS